MLPIDFPKALRKHLVPRLPLKPAARTRLVRWLRGREECRQLRRADAVIVSYEKSGRTWLRVMLMRYFQLRHGLPESAIKDYDDLLRLCREVPAIQFTHDRHLRYYTDLHPAERHWLFDKPVILLVRDPRDVAVSMYFHWQHRVKPRNRGVHGLPELQGGPGLFGFVTSPEYGLAAVARFMNHWVGIAAQHPRLSLFRYEALREDTVEQFSQLLRAIGEVPDMDVVREVVAYADFENMKRREQSGETANSRMAAGDPGVPESFKARRAKVGGYRDDFEPDQVAEIDRITQELLDPVFGYR